jgi:hypothetical protein
MMRASALVLLAMVPLARAEGAWVSYEMGDRAVVAHLTAAGAAKAVEFRTLSTFGQSDSSIAVVGREGNVSSLVVIDKRNPANLVRWSIMDLPAAWLSGPIPDVLLHGEFAYLLTLNMRVDGMPVNPRDPFRLTRIALRDGTTTAYPLGARFANPRLRTLDGSAVVTDWSGIAVSTLPPSGTELVPLIGESDLADIIPAEFGEREHPTLPYDSWSDYITVPGAGLFRLSKFGDLQRIADARLHVLPPPHLAVNVGPARSVRMLLAARADEQPAVAVITESEGKIRAAFIAAGATKITFEMQLPASASPLSVVASGSNSLTFIDNASRSVTRQDDAGIRTIAQFPAGAALSEARILSLD